MKCPVLPAVLLVILPLGAAPQPPVPSPPREKPFLLAELYGMGDECDYIDASVDLKGTLHILRGSRHLQLAHALASEAIRIDPAPVEEANRYYSGFKVRNGTYFYRKLHSIYTFDLKTRQWREYFTATKLFSQFEILPDGRIALICTGYPARKEAIRHPLVYPIDRLKPESARFVEVYLPGSRQPEWTLDLPEDYVKTASLVDPVRPVDLTFQVGTRFLLQQSQLGLLWLLDPEEKRLVPMELPWPHLSPAWLTRTAATLLKVPQPEKITRIAIPYGIWPEVYVLPQDTNRVLIQASDGMAPEGMGWDLPPDPHHSLAKDPSTRWVPRRAFTSEEMKKKAHRVFYDLDVYRGTLRRVGTHEIDPAAIPTTKFEFDLWIRSDGSVIPIDALKAAPRKPNQAPEEPVPPPPFGYSHLYTLQKTTAPDPPVKAPVPHPK